MNLEPRVNSSASSSIGLTANRTLATTRAAKRLSVFSFLFAAPRPVGQNLLRFGKKLAEPTAPHREIACMTEDTTEPPIDIDDEYKLDLTAGIDD